MKKMKFIISIVLLLIVAVQTFSQEKEEVKISLRHIEGFKGIEIGTGFTKFGYYVETGYAHYIKKNLIFSGKFNYEFGEIEISKLKNYNVYLGVDHSVIQIKEFAFINLGYAAIGSIGTSENTSLDKKESWVDYGVMAGLRAELFMSDRISFNLNFNQKYMFTDKFGKFQFQAGAGFRVFIQ